MKKIGTLILLSFSLTVIAQQKSEFWQQVRFGGGLSLSLGSQTTVGISPSAIYEFDNGFSLGTGISYIYSKFDEFTTNVYGASLISLYQIPNIGLQISGEYEYSFAKQKDSFDSLSTHFPALYLGIAYNNNGRFALGIRYDFLYDDNKNVYSSAISPIVRFYF